MAFTYSGDPSDSTLDQVRFLVGDTDSTDPFLQDAEVTWLIQQWTDGYEAARAAAEVMAGKFSQKASYSKSVGELSVSETSATQANEFRMLADRLAAQRLRAAPALPKINQQSIVNTQDRVDEVRTTDFYVGQFDNNGY